MWRCIGGQGATRPAGRPERSLRKRGTGEILAEKGPDHGHGSPLNEFLITPSYQSLVEKQGTKSSSKRLGNQLHE